MVAPKLNVRRARADDAQALAELQQGIYAEARWFVGDGAPATGILKRLLERIEPHKSLYLVAETKGRELCAWLELHRLQPRRMAHVAVLTIAVKKQMRRQGIARHLLDESYKWARGRGIEKITLSVREGNTAAMRLYQSEGFVLEGREVRQLRDGNHYEDNLLMAKFIS